jgi:hypothetical protein
LSVELELVEELDVFDGVEGVEDEPVLVAAGVVFSDFFSDPLLSSVLDSVAPSDFEGSPLPFLA